MIVNKSKLPLGLLIVAIFVLTIANPLLYRVVLAGTLTQSKVIELNMQASGTSSVAFAFTTASAGATSVTLNFTGWSGGAAGTVNATQTISTTGCQALTGASNVLPGGSLAAAGSGTTVTISNVTALSASQSYCGILSSSSAVTNPTATGTYSVTVTAGSDSQADTIDVISSDQYTVSATVPSSFTMSLSGTSDSFTANLSPTALTSTNGITATINTNAASGWLLWAEDANAGLKSASAGNYVINSVATGSNVTMNGANLGTEKYALGVTSVSAGSAAANYADAGGITGGGLSSTTFNQIASNTTPSSNDAVVIKELADIAGTTKPGTDYGDTITIVGAGSF